MTEAPAVEARSAVKEFGQGETAVDQEEAVAAMLARYEVCRGIFYGFDWSAWTAGDAAARLSLLPAAQEHVLLQEDGKARLSAAVTDPGPSPMPTRVTGGAS